jgi:hypothetical protein
VRFTNGPVGSIHMAPVFIQVPGLSNKEMPPEKLPSGVEILKVQGMAGDSGINLDSTSYGYRVLSYKCIGIEMIQCV